VTAILAPLAVQKFFDNNGAPLANGRMFSYAAGTTTKLATFTDSTGGTPNPNPQTLNARGEGQIWIPPNVAYKFTLAPPGIDDPPSSPIWTVDQIVNTQLTTLYGGTDTGAVNAYVLNFSAPFTSYIDGTLIYWTPSHTNTSASTLNVNGLGVVPIVNPDGSPVFAGQIVSGFVIQTIYKTSLSSFVLVGSTANAIIQGSFTPVWFGFAAAPTGDMAYQYSGSQVTLNWTGTTGTSNSTSMSITNVPLTIRPSASASDKAMVSCTLIDNNTSVIGAMGFSALSTFQFSMGSPLSLTGFNGGAVVKGLPSRWSVTYLRF
jgi:hypothetical protein